MTRAPDHDARVLAATSFDRNLVVVAGAGSGKTTLLIERLLNLLLGRGMRLAEIVALTFTEKAAAEMRERLAAQLSRVLEILDDASLRGEDPATWSLQWITCDVALGGAGVSDPVARERALAAMADLDGGSIGTIHAWCADLLRRHPQEARIDPGFRVDDGSLTARVIDEEWTRFEAESLALGSPQEPDWRVVLARFDANIVRDAASALVSKGVQGAAGSTRALETLGLRVGAAREGLARARELATNEKAKAWAGILDGVLGSLAEGGAEAVANSLSSAPFPTKSVPVPGKGCADPAAVTTALEEAHALAKTVSLLDDACCDALLRLGLDVAARVRQRLAVEGIATFQGLLVGARDLLMTSLAVRRAEQERVKAILLDEFQDTDPLQYEIAFLLGEDPAQPLPEGGDAWSARLRPGRLFIVGDPKQSIYRFRGADMAAYERAVTALEGQGAAVVSLIANFRSVREILEPVNVICEGLIKEDAPYQPAYERLEAARDRADAGEPRVEIWTVASAARHAEERRLAEARAIGRHLRERRDAGAMESFGDVAMLFRAMTDVALYQRGLSESGVPFVTQGGRGFVEREEIVHAVALLRVLVKPNDASSLLAILRSPSCGASDDELRIFAEVTGRRWFVAAHRLVPGERRGDVPRVVRTLAGLEDLARRVCDLPADEAIRTALAEPFARVDDSWRPHLVSLHAASHSGAQRLANLEKLVSRAEELARGEGLSLARVVDRLWDEMKEGSDQGESPLADESVDAVRIMSIHQCKGLEFPVVFLPDLARQEMSRRETAAVGLVVRDGLVAMRLRGGVRNAASLVIEGADRKHAAAESCRILYVALTRAKERLVLVNAHPDPGRNAWPFVAIRDGWGYDPARGEGIARALAPGVVHRDVADCAEPVDVSDVPAVTDLVDAVTAQDAAAAALGAARRRRPRSATGLKEEAEREQLADGYVAAEAGVALSAERGESVGADAHARPHRPRPGGGSLARAVGIAVHAALEAGSIDAPAALALLGRRAARLAANDAGEDAGAVERRTVELLTSLGGTELAGALTGARVLARELPFSMERDGEAWQGFIDLVIEKDGEIIVVDWKTDAVRDPERHRAQLELYAEAVRRWLGLARPPRTALAYL